MKGDKMLLSKEHENKFAEGVVDACMYGRKPKRK